MHGKTSQWVPSSEVIGPGAPDDLSEGFETQTWLAAGQDPEAKRSGRYLRKIMEANYNPQAAVIEIQEKFLDVCGQLTGIKFS